MKGSMTQTGLFLTSFTACPCQNGGVCVQNGTCDCTNTGFMGDNCDVPVCPHTMVVSQYDYQQVPVPNLSTRSSLVFSVKACADAHLAISTSLDLSSNMLEIVIGAGSNTYQTIRSCQKFCPLRTVSGGLLSCNVSKPFWVAWKTSGTSSNVTSVALGEGLQPGVEENLSSNISYAVKANYVSIASFVNTVGTWVFDFPEQTNPCQTTTMTTENTASSPASITSTSQDVTTIVLTITSSPTTVTPTSQDVTTTVQTTTETSIARTDPQAINTPTAENTAVMKDSLASSTTTSSPETTSTQIFNSISQSSPFSSTPECHSCLCTEVQPAVRAPQNKSAADQAATDLKRHLMITTQTSLQQRRYISAYDDRPSAKNIGYLGIVMLVVMALLIVVPDAFTLAVWCCPSLKRATVRVKSV